MSKLQLMPSIYEISVVCIYPSIFYLYCISHHEKTQLVPSVCGFWGESDSRIDKSDCCGHLLEYTGCEKFLPRPPVDLSCPLPPHSTPLKHSLCRCCPRPTLHKQLLNQTLRLTQLKLCGWTDTHRQREGRGEGERDGGIEGETHTLSHIIHM